MGTGAGVAWLVAGTIATCISAIAAAASALFSARALQSQTRAVDVSSYLEIFERNQQMERRLRASASNARSSNLSCASTLTSLKPLLIFILGDASEVELQTSVEIHYAMVSLPLSHEAM